MTEKKILVIGDVMLDTYHFGKVNRISPEAPVPVFLETGRKRHVPGGAGNVAVNIAAIGVSVDLCSVAGQDETADILKALLEERGVGIHGIGEIPGRRTTNKVRFIGPNNQQILRVDTEDSGAVSYEAVRDSLRKIWEAREQYALFLLSDYNKGFLTEEITQAFIKIAKESRIPILIDVKDKYFLKYRGATLLKPNRKELSDLTGMRTDTPKEVAEAAKYLCRETSCRYVLTTLGAEGMILTEKDCVVKEVRSAAKEVYDVTGAGDTSIAYLAAELVLGKDMLEAMEISNYAAGLQVSKVGTSVVYPEEVAHAMHRAGVETDGKIKRLNFYQENGLEQLKQRQKRGCRTVFTNGCFDILHAGHIQYLKEAKKLGDILVVGVNTDESVKRLKGEDRPINSLEDRLTLLSALEDVDYVVPFREDTPLELIKKVSPDVLVKGGDYQNDGIVGAEEVKKRGGKVQTLPFVDGKSTTNILEKVRKEARKYGNSK